MFKKSSVLVLCLCLAIVSTISNHVSDAEEAVWYSGNLVKREQRTTLVSAEYGQISAVRVGDNVDGSYLLHFFTLEPNSLLLPVLLHADMVFYVHTGSGKLSWTEEDDLKSTELRRGDVYALQQGSVFFMQSNLETTGTERQKLRIHAIFTNSKNGLQGPVTGPYSSIREMVFGFDRKVLQAAFKASEEVIDELLGGSKPPAIIHAVQEAKRMEMESEFVRNLLGGRSYSIFELNKRKKKTGAKAYNLFKEDRDFKNCNGWSTAVTKKKLSALKGTNMGVFMVNLTIGSMMGPHWNPRATEVAIVLQGHGMVRTVCSSISNETACRNMRFEVEEGDVFLVPRFHPMAQMAFNNETFVFMGFSTSTKKNHPQFLAGKASVFRTLDKGVLATSFNVTNTTVDALLATQDESVILGCASCAEEELRIMEEEMEREREEERQRGEEEARQEEEERKREEEEARKREEKEARREEEEKRRREAEEEKRRREEEARRREEEEAARRKEEERRRHEEERQTEQEERRTQEEEARRREEEEAARRKEEERQRQQEKEEARQQEEEEARRREQEEEAARQQEEQARRKEQEEEAARQREEAQQREQEEEAQRREQEQQEEARQQREEEQAAKEERRREEEVQREEEAARQQERERQREEARQREQEEEEEASRRQQQEEEAASQRRQEHEEKEASRRREEEEAQSEEEAARQQERERQRRQEEEEEEKEGGEDEGEGGGWLLI